MYQVWFYCGVCGLRGISMERNINILLSAIGSIILMVVGLHMREYKTEPAEILGLGLMGLGAALGMSVFLL